MKRVQISDKSKALAGAVTMFVSVLSNHLLTGAPLADVLSSGATLLELLVSMVIGYAIVYWFPKNAEKR